jgi:DNA-3-methyladenine glycosylase
MSSENSSSSARRKLSRSFYTRRDALTAARDLLGKRLVVATADGARLAGLIVETEAYMGAEDKASHAYANRRTARTESMYAEGGRAYVYFIYGMYYQFNVVVNRREVPHAVLVRAVEPTEGLASMLERRPVRRERDLTNGPGKLCAAFGLDRSYDRADLCGERVWIEDARRAFTPGDIASGARVGIDYAEEFAQMPWRFWVRDNPFVSRKG